MGIDTSAWIGFAAKIVDLGPVVAKSHDVSDLWVEAGERGCDVREVGNEYVEEEKDEGRAVFLVVASTSMEIPSAGAAKIRAIEHVDAEKLWRAQLEGCAAAMGIEIAELGWWAGGRVW